MQDIKPIPRKVKLKRSDLENKNSINELIKKVIISILILFFIGIIVFYFVQEKNKPRSKNIKVESSENIENSNEKNDSNLSEAESIVEEKIEKNNVQVSSVEAEKIIKQKSEKVIDSIKNKDFATISTLMHPDKTLVFSPYANFSEKNQSFSQDKIRNILSDSKKYIWGEYNGLSTGKIEMSFADYYELFIYDQDFSNAEKISFNQDISVGNIKNNAQNFFENSITVEYHFSGFEPEFAGMDWKSLRLIFIEIDDEWYLKGVSHDGWTI